MRFPPFDCAVTSKRETFVVISLVIGSLLLLAPGVSSPESARLEATVGRLVPPTRLEADCRTRFGERDLLELGPGVLPLLPIIDERTSAEAATRIARVQQELLRTRALAAAEPTLVTLRGDDLSLLETLREISKQTGNPIVDHRRAFGEEQRDVRVKANFDKTPFWKALDSLLDQGGLALYGFSGNSGAFVVGRPPEATPRAAHAFYSGMFRFEPLKLVAVRDLRSRSMESLKLLMEVSWEPRLQPFAILQPMAEVSATDSSGETMTAVTAEGEPEAMIRGGVSTIELEIPLSLPKREMKNISLLSGKIRVFMPGPKEDFRLPSCRWRLEGRALDAWNSARPGADRGRARAQE